MINYVLKEHSTQHSEIVKSIRDAQLAPDVNTSSICVLDKVVFWEQNYVEFVLKFMINAYPDNLIDKLTFYSDHRFIIIDNDRCFFTGDEKAYDIFADLYVAAFNKCNELFVGELGDSKLSSKTIQVNEETKQTAADIMNYYFDKQNPG